MAFVVRNKSKKVGEVKINDNWVSLFPGQSISVSEKPVSITPNLKVFPVSEPKNKVNNKSKKTKKGFSGDSGLSLTDDSSLDTVIEGDN